MCWYGNECDLVVTRGLNYNFNINNINEIIIYVIRQTFKFICVVVMGMAVVCSVIMVVVVVESMASADDMRALFHNEVKPRLAKRAEVGAYNQEI